MLHTLLQAIKVRMILVLITIHVGLVLAVYGLAAISREVDLGHTYWILWAGIAALYGGTWLAFIFIFSPVYSATQKIRHVMNWQEWIVKELPQIISTLPSVITALQNAYHQITATRNKAKSHPKQSD
jgi:hypothetical protein